jgi:hypothetical protein
MPWELFGKAAKLRTSGESGRVIAKNDDQGRVQFVRVERFTRGAGAPRPEMTLESARIDEIDFDE